MFMELQVEQEDVISEETVNQPFPDYEGGAIGSGTEETAEAVASAPLGLNEAEHLAIYLRRIDALVGKMCAKIGLSREELRSGAMPAPETEVSLEERHQVGELSQGLARIARHVGPEDAAAISDYAEQQVLQALCFVQREIDPEEVRLWLPPEAQEALQVEDCRLALERLADGSEIRIRTVLLGAGESRAQFGHRTFLFRGCGMLHRVYRSPFIPPTLKLER